MTKIDYDKLQDSLEHIKSVCEKFSEDGGCAQCPLGSRDGICQLGIAPTQWVPKHPKVDPFRVLA